MINKYDFAYSVALIRALETLLLNKNEVERMMLAKDAKDAFKVLNEFDYADNKAGIENAADFQKVIDEGLMEIQDLLVRVTPNKRVLNIIFHQYDFHNIKTMVKAKLLAGRSEPVPKQAGAEPSFSFEKIENILSKMGAIPIESLKLYIFEEINAPFGLTELTEAYIKKKIKKVEKLFEKEDNNPQVIDLYLDQKLMKIVYGIAKDSQNEFLQNYITKLIDLNNIRLFFRMKSQEKGSELHEIANLWNGSIPYSKFKDAYKHNLSEFPELMKVTAYSKIIEAGYKHYEEEKTFIYLEREIENHLTNYIKRAKLIPFGPEALVAYFLAKKNNALIIRMIMVNKLNEIEPEEIQKRLRELYV